jgi:phospholipase C
MRLIKMIILSIVFLAFLTYGMAFVIFPAITTLSANAQPTSKAPSSSTSSAAAPTTTNTTTHQSASVQQSWSNTNTPIKHIVILFQEDISFDHYFGTYPNATNPPGEPKFVPSPNTPSVNRLNSILLYQNPNSANPSRLDRSASVTCAMNHHYTEEQSAYHGGADKFVEYTSPTTPEFCTDPQHKQQVMDYYDGNTVTALWNYAQHFAMSDSFFRPMVHLY